MSVEVELINRHHFSACRLSGIPNFYKTTTRFSGWLSWRLMQNGDLQAERELGKRRTEKRNRRNALSAE